MTDEQLREAYAQAVERRGGTERDRCPTPEALLALARRQGPEGDRLATLDHAMACPACRDEFELLRSIERAGGEGAHEAVEQIRWRRYASVAIAASALLAVSLGPGRQLWERDDDPTRGGADEVTAVAPAADAVVSGAPVTFTWRAVSGTRGYTLEVLTAAGAVAVSRETADTTLVLTAPPALAPGEYHWWVRAQAEDGSERRSAARRLRVE
jgi:hypothetical protein